MLTKDAMIVQSSHQNGAAEILLASNRAATAIVAATTLIMLPSHTFHARLSSGGNDMAVTMPSQQESVEERLIKCKFNGEESERLGKPPTKFSGTFLFHFPTLPNLDVRVLAIRPVGSISLELGLM